MAGQGFWRAEGSGTLVATGFNPHPPAASLARSPRSASPAPTQVTPKMPLSESGSAVDSPLELLRAAVSSEATGRVKRAELAPLRSAPNPPSDTATLVQSSPAWLVSMIVHMLVLIILGLCVVKAHEKELVELHVYAEKRGDQLLTETFDLSGESKPLLEQDSAVLTPSFLPPVEDPFAAPANLDVDLNGMLATSQIESHVVGLALSGREVGKKDALLRAYGGTATTEGAVLEGLRWLARNQRSDGSWSLTGPYQDAGRTENKVAATAMALLAFQGAGHTHLKSTDAAFQKVVSKGWQWLLKQQSEEGLFFKGGHWNHRLYTHAQATIALCELYGMTGDSKLVGPAEEAIAYAVKIQDAAGGWRYNPGMDSDLSVTGWMVMALQSARMARMEVPQTTLDKVSYYLNQVQVDGGRLYTYQPGGQPRLSMTAEGLLCRQYLGWKKQDERLVEGVEVLVENRPDWSRRDAYYWYYATQVCHHQEGEAWKKWNEVMRQLIPEKQERTGGEKGSWNPVGDQWGDEAGRLYVTCLHIFMLEVYYRHLPLYRSAIPAGKLLPN